MTVFPSFVPMLSPKLTIIVVPFVLVLDTVLVFPLKVIVQSVVLLSGFSIQLFGNGPISILSPDTSPFDNLFIFH